MSQLVADTFSRSNQAGWGTSSSGHTWTQIDGTATLAVSSNEGTATGSVNTNSMRLGSTLRTAVNVEGIVTTQMSATNAKSGIELRIQDANNYYVCRLNGANNTLELCLLNAGVFSVLANASFTVSAATNYKIRFRTQGTTIEGKVWLASGAEPGGWTVTTTDSTITTAGNVGLYTLAGATGTVIQFDHFTATNLQDTLDLVMRARFLAATSTKDLAMRAGVTITVNKNLAMRARVFALSATKDLAMRARVYGFGQKDLSMRATLAEAVNALPAWLANSFTVSVGGYANLTILEGSYAYSEMIDGRHVCSFAIRDDSGTLHIGHRQPVEVTHAVRGIVFTGFVNSAQESNLPPNTTNILSVTCIDEHYLADKRAYEGEEFVNEYAGDIAVSLAAELANEGVTAAYALDRDTSIADFAQGTLSGVIATSNVGSTSGGDGDLELSPAGQTVTVSEGTAQADYGFGSFVNTQTNGVFGSKVLVLLKSSAIKLTGHAAIPGGGNLYSYQKIWTGAYTFQSGDTVNYDVWISSTSAQIQAGVDLVMTDGSTMRDISNQGCRDQQQIHAHPGSDLSGFANDQWYSRTIGTTALTGKTTSYASVAFEGDTVGLYTAYFRHIRILDSSGNLKATIFESSLNVNPAQQLQNQGYTGVSASVVTAYQQNGYRISPSYSLNNAGIARASLISWQDIIPTDANAPSSSTAYSITVEASLDNGHTWQLCTNNQPIPGIMPGLNMRGQVLLLRETLSNTTTDPTQTPQLTSLQATVQPSYAYNKVDGVITTATQADWLAGSFSGSTAYLNGVYTMNGYTRTWDSASKTGQTTYGGNIPFTYVLFRQLVLQSDNNADVRERLDFAGQWQNFTAEVDVTIGAFTDARQNTGIVYRTTGWQNNNDTYAYSVYVNQTQFVLAKGTNSSVGSGTFTPLSVVGLSLSSGNTHRLKVVVNGNSHMAYLDDVLYINVSDSTYTGAGYLGLRYYNTGGNMPMSAPGYVATTSYTTVTVDYISQPIADAALITLDLGGLHPETVYAYGAQAATNNQTAIQITTNSLGSGHAQVAFTAGFNHATGCIVAIAYRGFTTFNNFGVASSTSGVRTSPSVDLTSTGTAWDSYIGWNATIPGSSTLLMEASLDGGNTWKTCTNGAAIPVIARGTNLAGVGLKFRTTLSTNSVDQIPSISAMTAWIVSQINASGYRVSPPLSLSPVGRVGSSLVAWNATLASDNTLLGVDVSPDGSTWTDVTGSNGGTIPFINSQAVPYVDNFSIDQSTLYTSSFITGGGASATWTVDTPNSRIIASGGANGFFSPTGQVLGDGEIIFDTDYADFGGMFWRISADHGSCYGLAVQDSAAPRTPNVMKLFKIVNGVSSQIGLGSALSFTRGTPTRFKIVQTGGNITITTNYPVLTSDGALVGGNTQTITYTDPSPLQAGSVALRSNGGTNHYSLLRFTQYGDDVSNKSLYTRLRLSTTDPLYTPQVQDLNVSVRGNTIDTGALIPATTYSTLSGSTNTMAQNYDDLASQSSYWWRILQRVLYFQSTTANPAPFVVTGNDMLYNATVTVNYSSDLYRNEQIIIGGIDVLPRSEIRVADGIRSGFDTLNRIDSITTILVNGQPQSFGIQGVDSGKQWYYQQGQIGITQDASGTPLADGTQIEIDYEGQVQVIAKARNEGQITLLAAIDKTSGVVTIVENASGLNSAAAQALAQSRLQQYSIIDSIDLGFTTGRPGLHIGQLLTVFLSQHQLINKTFLITKVDYSEAMVTANGIQTLYERFAVQATSGPIVSDWTLR